MRVLGQQENDDPNWRERSAEELIKRIEKLNKEVEKLNNEFEKLKRNQAPWDPWQENLRRILDRPSSTPKSRFFDIYDYGPRDQGYVSWSESSR
jgi:hypothetical protein